MQAVRRKEGQGCGGQHGLGDDGSGADDGGNRLGDHVGSWCQSSRVRDDQGSRNWAGCVVSDDASETTRGSGSDSQDGGENSQLEHVDWVVGCLFTSRK